METNRMIFEDISFDDFDFIGDFLYISHGTARRWISLSDILEVSYIEEEKKLYVYYREDKEHIISPSPLFKTDISDISDRIAIYLEGDDD